MGVWGLQPPLPLLTANGPIDRKVLIFHIFACVLLACYIPNPQPVLVTTWPSLPPLQWRMCTECTAENVSGAWAERKTEKSGSKILERERSGLLKKSRSVSGAWAERSVSGAWSGMNYPFKFRSNHHLIAGRRCHSLCEQPKGNHHSYLT